MSPYTRIRQWEDALNERNTKTQKTQAPYSRKKKTRERASEREREREELDVLGGRRLTSLSFSPFSSASC